MWFRPELVRQVDWGGDPHNAKLAAAEGDDVRLSPRKSFDLWRETVRGRAEPWHESEVRAATQVRPPPHGGAVAAAAAPRRDRHRSAAGDAAGEPADDRRLDAGRPRRAGRHRADRRRLVRRVRGRRRPAGRGRRRRRRPRPAGLGRDGAAAQQPAGLPARRPDPVGRPRTPRPADGSGPAGHARHGGLRGHRHRECRRAAVPCRPRADHRRRDDGGVRPPTPRATSCSACAPARGASSTSCWHPATPS